MIIKANCVILILLVTASTVFSQKKVLDAKVLFAQHLLQENIVVLNNKITGEFIYDPVKMNIDIDSLSKYDVNIVFYKFTLGKNRLVSKDSNIAIIVYSSSCNTYVLAVNLNSFNSYRLKGFAGNDLLFLLKDINESLTEFKTDLKLLNELKDLQTGLDFKCLYKAFQKCNMKSKCIIPCNEPINAHGKVNKK